MVQLISDIYTHESSEYVSYIRFFWGLHDAMYTAPAYDQNAPDNKKETTSTIVSCAVVEEQDKQKNETTDSRKARFIRWLVL